ncbi:acylphosphatase [Clostridium puniceum]|uniref:acylphosphatase n=1 Tax=Clostridium puniceum TaxID=29367 RepID=A0A1S8T9J5_9CLOT|nr:acylphosphatase [Clostridium puniceum]OOM74447.1 acylphosphatase [Clostridium puniceum]
MVRYLINVDGRVQGVGFRYFTQIAANTLNLTGWCENLMNGKVQIEVQGSEQYVHLFIAKIKQGNTFCRVSNMELVNIPVINDEKKFSIKY